MAGMRDYSDQEIDLVRKSFSGRFALRDRAYFEMALQIVSDDVKRALPRF